MQLLLLLAMSAGVVVASWYVSRLRRGDDPLPPARPSELPNTLFACGMGVVMWWLLLNLAVALLAKSDVRVAIPDLVDLFVAVGVNALVALAVLPAATRGPRPPRGAARNAFIGLLGGLGAYAIVYAVAVVIQAVYVVLDRLAPEQQIVVEAQRADAMTAVVYALTAVVIAPFAEEVFFRGTLLPAAVRLAGVRSGLLIQAVVFGAIHVVQTPEALPLAIPLAVVGWCAGLLRLRTGSLVAPIALHATFNALNFIALRSG
jgi:membrane protease YdiL (CAAX protease family)